MNTLAEKVAQKLGITLEAAQTAISQEVARKAASERYRQSQAYKDRLELQKVVRKEIRSVSQELLANTRL